MTKSKKVIFKVAFIQDDTIVELYAKHVGESEMFGFVAIEEIIFGENTSLVVDPSEERLKEQFKDVKCTYVPVHSILRIDEVEKEGVSKIKPLTSMPNNISPISNTIYANRNKDKKGD